MLRTQQPPSTSYDVYIRVMDSPKDTRGYLEFVDSMTTIEFDVDRELFRTEFDKNQDPVSLAVVALVATVLDKDPDHLTPLYSLIDGDALEEPFLDSPNTQREQGHTFTFEGFEVTVFGDGKIEAVPQENA